MVVEAQGAKAMSKHTPGPWIADWDDGGQWYVNIGGLSVSGNALRGDSGNCVESANARLIACAPEMYELLQYLRNYAYLDLGDDTKARLNALLAKAEGTPATPQSAPKYQETASYEKALRQCERAQDLKDDR